MYLYTIDIYITKTKVLVFRLLTHIYDETSIKEITVLSSSILQDSF